MIKSIDENINTISGKLFGGHEKTAKRILLTTVLTCFFCYFYEMIYGYGGPDSICEGVYFYRTADYSTAITRWVIRFLNGFVGKNLIFPFIIVVLYCLMIGAASFVLCREFSVESGVSQVLLTAALISFPVVLTHFAYPYIALTYSLSFLMVVLGVFFARNGRIWGMIAAVLCFVIMLGSYQ
ncbi:MAG: glucosyltransferase domain-containing protein, partial [Lachnospiraceae bacterium]|nr:glucosyltransferase domain-containing protein [Lachnospiraceae bacterium]